jgi:hypothetical protein
MADKITGPVNKIAIPTEILGFQFQSFESHSPLNAIVQAPQFIWADDRFEGTGVDQGNRQGCKFFVMDEDHHDFGVVNKKLFQFASIRIDFNFDYRHVEQVAFYLNSGLRE